MNQKRFVGFTLLLSGILLSLSRIALTGAVVGIEKSSLAGIAGAIVAVIGILIVLSSFVKP